jgi:DNA-directed RNA polymerase subunit M/transcription elongation factor TFIIS
MKKFVLPVCKGCNSTLLPRRFSGGNDDLCSSCRKKKFISALERLNKKQHVTIGSNIIPLNEEPFHNIDMSFLEL